jgi:hypothetical protein
MTARLTALIVTTAVLGFLLGARAVGNPTPTANASGVREMHSLRGGFWRPAGSDAARPAVTLERAAWSPAAPAVSDAHPDALAAVRAVVRLAAFE